MNNFDSGNLPSNPSIPIYNAPKISRLGNLIELTQAMNAGTYNDGNFGSMFNPMGEGMQG